MSSSNPDYRIQRDEYFLRMATLVSMRSTCARRHTGCVLVDDRNHVLSTGYNGVPAGFTHCRGHPIGCVGASAPPGKALEECLATHAEQNALLQCRDPFSISTVYCTDSPCVHCVKLILNTSAHRIVFSREYPHDAAKRLWLSRANVGWLHYRLDWPFVLQESHYRKEK